MIRRGDTMDETFGVNVHQDVQGCVEEFNKLHEEPVIEDVPKEAMEPSREALDYVRKGRLNPETGASIPPTCKTRTACLKQFGTPSAAYLRNFDAIRWDL